MQEIQETRIQSLGLEDPLEKQTATIPIFLPEKFHGQRSLEGYSPKGHKESDTTEQLSMHINGLEPFKAVNHYIVHMLLT